LYLDAGADEGLAVAVHDTLLDAGVEEVHADLDFIAIVEEDPVHEARIHGSQDTHELPHPVMILSHLAANRVAKLKRNQLPCHNHIN
jgi:hypothetical protein